MASLDRARDALVVRIVYDGPPTAGKTTSLRALAGRLQQGEVFTPEASTSGRTLFFDWLEYTGGRFDGREIRCQLVSVPGQPELDPRRRLLLRSADAVVFVADSSACGAADSVAALGALRASLATLTTPPPVGVVVQANKRDLPGAVDKDVFGGVGVAVVEAVAARGDGVREAFVFAVRLALDRVREQVRSGALPDHDEHDDASALLRTLRALPVQAGAGALFPDDTAALLSPPTSAPTPAATPTSTPTSTVTTNPAPPLPTTEVQSGAIWPPVTGRALLHEAMAAAPTAPRELSPREWWADGGGWRFHSSADAWFADVDSGRAALIRWAQVHAALAGFTSSQRLIVLCDAGDGGVRLWQVVKSELSLWRFVQSAVGGAARPAATDAVKEAVAICKRAAERWARSPWSLPCTLETVSAVDGCFISLVPDLDRLPPPAPPTTKLLRQLQALVQGAVGDDCAAAFVDD